MKGVDCYEIFNHRKQNLIQRYNSGESATNICLQAGIARSTFYTWLKANKPVNTELNQLIKPNDYYKLKNRANRLEQIIEVLKIVKCTVSSPTKEKLTELEKLHGQYSVHLICEALNVPRGTFYNHIFRNKRENNSYQFRRTILSEQIKQIYDESNQIFGARKIKVILSEQGVNVSDKMISELMSEMNIVSIRSDSKKIYNRMNPRVKKDALKMDFNAKSPNKVWISDTTYFRLHNKTYYICAILDLFSRKAIAHNVSVKHSSQLINTTFKRAYADRKPDAGLIFHSDRGTQYTSHSLQKLLNAFEVTQSFSPSGSPHHNAVIESFFSSLKREELYRTNYHSVNEFKERLAHYMDFYNDKRPHKTLNFKTPNAYESIFHSQTKQQNN